MSQSARSKRAAPKTSQKCCAAALCTNRSDDRKYLTFHAFPKDSQRRMEWVVKMKRSDSKFNAPINVKPQGGGQADPGEFYIFTRARVKFHTPGHLENVKLPPLVTAFCPKQVIAMSNSRPQRRTQMSKSPPREKLAESI